MSYPTTVASFNLHGGGLRSVTLALLLLVAMPLQAADLASAKQAGWLGEQSNGYLGLVNPKAPADVKQLMKSVNSKRLQHYKRIASRNGIPLVQVEQMAGRKAIQKSAPGAYIRLASGSWKRK